MTKLLSSISTLSAYLLLVTMGCEPSLSDDSPDQTMQPPDPGSDMAILTGFQPNRLMIWIDPGDIVPTQGSNIYTPVCGRAGSIGSSYMDDKMNMHPIEVETRPYPDQIYSSTQEVKKVLDRAFATKLVDIKKHYKAVLNINYRIENGIQRFITDDIFTFGAEQNRSSACRKAITYALEDGYTLSAITLVVVGDVLYSVEFDSSLSSKDKVNLMGILAGELGAEVDSMENRLIKGRGVRWGVLVRSVH